MTNLEQIRKYRDRIHRLDMRIRLLHLKISSVRELCPHEHTKKWTKNDGDGQFTVERCLDCERQKDGGLK